jgi:hypothetical protein
LADERCAINLSVHLIEFRAPILPAGDYIDVHGSLETNQLALRRFRRSVSGQP